MSRGPSLTFEGALKVLGHYEPRQIEKFDTLLGSIILAGGATAGLVAIGVTPLAPVAAFGLVWGWVEQKGLAVDLLTKAVKSASRKIPGVQGRERRELIAAAHSAIVVAAVFEALRDHIGVELYGQLKITDEEKISLLRQMNPEVRDGLASIYADDIPAPSPTRGFEENVPRVRAWQSGFADPLQYFLSGLTVTEKVHVDWPRVLEHAIERYRSHYLELAAKAPEYKFSAQLNEHAATRAAIGKVGSEVGGAIADLRGDVAKLGSGIAEISVQIEGLNEVAATALGGSGDRHGRDSGLIPVVRESDFAFVFQESAAPIRYVRRPQLEQQLLDLLRARRPIVVVAGPPSTGKRTLVTNVLKSMPMARTVTIDAVSPETAQQSMFKALLRMGKRYDQIGPMPQYPLKQSIDSPGGPEYLVIENASTLELPQFFASKEARVTIIVTTTQRLTGVSQQECVEVDRMSDEEAARLVSEILPGTSAPDASMLAAALDCQVLAIIAACGMIKESKGAPIPEFCRDLRKHMAAVFDGERDQSYPALTQIYRQTLIDLSQETPQALRALELVAYLHETDALSAFVVLALGSTLGIDLNDKLHLRTVGRRAVTALYNRYLINVDKQGLISMPYLAKTIISHLLHDRGPEICRNLRVGILHLVTFSRDEWPQLPLKDFLDRHRGTLLHLMNTYIDPKKSGRPEDYLYVYAQGLADLLRAIGEPPWRVMLVMIETSQDSFSLLFKVLPEGLSQVKRPKISLEWRDMTSHRIEYEIPGWETRKAMQALFLSQSNEIVPVDAETA
jgi:NACHT N-terminal Helical domain 7